MDSPYLCRPVLISLVVRHYKRLSLKKYGFSRAVWELRAYLSGLQEYIPLLSEANFKNSANYVSLEVRHQD